MCHRFSVHPCCATLNMKPQNTGYYLLFTISILELKNKGNGQVHTLFKMNHTIFLPLTWAIYCSSLKWTSCLQTDITHNSSHCQVLVWGPLRCLKSAIHICAGSPFSILNIPLKMFYEIYSWRLSESTLHHASPSCITRHHSTPFIFCSQITTSYFIRYSLLYFTFEQVELEICTMGNYGQPLALNLDNFTIYFNHHWR